MGMLVIWSGSVNIWKASKISSLQVSVGSNMIGPWLALAILFSVFLVLVRERFPCSSLLSGLSFGVILFSLICASCTQVCGCWHLLIQSLTHSWQMQAMFNWWLVFGSVSQRQAEICIRSATLVTWWQLSRHFDAIPVIGHGSATMWYQVGSCKHRSGVSLIAARFRLYFFLTLIILIVPSSMLFALAPQVVASHDCRNTFILTFLLIFSGAAVLIRRSMTFAHVGLIGVSCRYSFSHIISITLFLAFKSSRLRPHSCIGHWRASIAILREESCSHMKSCMILVKANSI